ncbi:MULTISPECIES: zinc-ribbon domain-containing protein [Halorussus]|uniref:zinc-ribbon domain-containing protein n=1 Tax=Halorussus TaxID=1070314 RepID=UPI00209ED410|nr:zinc-ribbon domain-containing protein [Halorussus vallis]USZ75905.1 zinc-ribbon domain-containing protein [Halorussus vallis]
MSDDANVSVDRTDREESGGDSEALRARVESLEETVETLTRRLSDLEGNVTWMARHQAAETGNGACPNCNTGGALTVERAPTGKKEVRCTNCDESLR